MKRTKKYLTVILAISMLFSLTGCVEGKKSPDPNRTTESCSRDGTTKVYGAAHQNSLTCTPDADGWYYVGFGHHHHK